MDNGTEHCQCLSKLKKPTIDQTHKGKEVIPNLRFYISAFRRDLILSHHYDSRNNTFVSVAEFQFIIKYLRTISAKHLKTNLGKH